MGGKYKAYPEYKNSGDKWLGDIPLHWEAWKWKHALSEPMQYGANEAALDDNRENPRYIRITDMNADGSLKDETFKSLPEEIAQDYLLHDGDILVARTGATVGKSFLYKSEFGSSCFAGYLIKARSNNSIVEPKFLYWFLQSDQYWKYVSGSQIQATIQNVSAEKYGELKFALPELRQERQQITNFLDHETAKIDTLIEEQQSLIRLLKEKRQAVISHAVTKGLNPDAPMKDSGVEWFDSQPDHWRLLELKFTAEDRRKKFTDGDWIESPFITDSGVRLLQTGNVGIGEFKEKGFRYISETTYRYLNCTEVKPNDVLICRLDGPVGRSCLAPDLGVKVITSVDNAILKPNKNFDPRYIVYLTNSTPWLKWIQDLCRVGGGFRLRISRTMLGEQRIPAPPIEEQKATADELDGISYLTENCIRESEESIELLKERRTALISAAVTGKIDVRDWVAPAHPCARDTGASMHGAAPEQKQLVVEAAAI